MRLVTYSVGSEESGRAGVRVGHRVLDIEAGSRVKGEPLPFSMKALLAAGRGALSRVQAMAKAATTEARSFSQAMLEERAIRFLPPVPDANRILCLENNYRQRAGASAQEGRKNDAAHELSAFALRSRGLLGHDAKVARPPANARPEFGPELVFVIGRHAMGATNVDALDYAAGVTILNRFACRLPQNGKETRSDSPANNRTNGSVVSLVGPEIVTMDEIADPYDLWLTCFVNGEERMRVNTSEQVWRLPEIIEHFSRDNPIEPGDLLSTGTIRGVGAASPGASERPLKTGDVVECSIEGIVMLRAMIAAPEDC